MAFFPSSSSRLGVAIGFLAGTLALAACGDDDAIARPDGGGTGDPDGGVETTDGGSTDGAAPADANETDAPLAPIDAGPRPSCDGESEQVSVGTGFDGDRDGDPDELVAFEPGGPYALVYRHTEGTLGADAESVQARIIGADLSEGAVTTIDRIEGEAVQLGVAKAVVVDGSLVVAWDQTEVDMDGRLVASSLRSATVDESGMVVRDAFEVQSNAASPYLAARGARLFILRSALTFSAGFTGVRPVIQEVAPDGTIMGEAYDLTSLVDVASTDLQLIPTSTGLALLSRTPPSSLQAIPFGEDGAPAGPARRTDRVFALDDAASSGAVHAASYARGTSSGLEVGLILLEPDGQIRARVPIEAHSDVTAGRSAVVAAWPGFLVLYRVGEGERAELWAAGVGLDGRVLVPAEKVVETPFGRGPVFASTDGSRVTVAFGARPPAEPNRLLLSRVCIPR